MMGRLKGGTTSKMPFTVTFTFFLCFLHVVTPLQIIRTFRDIKRNQLQNLQVHKTTGDLYVGATNTLLHLSHDLSLLEYLNIGPGIDNPHCPPPQIPCNLTKISINSFSRGITISYQDNTLIACISLYQGPCQIRELRNISVLQKEVIKPIVSNNPEKSSILFIGPGVGSRDSLYVGTTYSNFGLLSYRDLVPHISERDTTSLDIAYKDVKGGTQLSILPDFREYSVNFIYGFTHGSFVYFIVTQAKSDMDNDLESKIIRICQKDKYFNSYTEISLLCIERQGDLEYTIASGAYYDEDTGNLYVTFQKGQVDQKYPSAVCSFKMKETEDQFNKTVEACYNGNGYIGPEQIHASVPCKKSTGPVDYCGQTPESKNFTPIEGQNSIFQTSIISFPYTSLNSVAALKKSDNDVLFLGTGNGKLKKVIVSPGNVAKVVKEIEIEAGQDISREMLFSPDKTMLYVMTNHKLTMVDTRHCPDKKTCEECTMSPDPVCGWCVMENSCTEKDRCAQSEVFPHWLPSRKGACAKMVAVHPQAVSFEDMRISKEEKQITFKLDEIMLAPGKRPNMMCSFSEREELSKTLAVMDNGFIRCALPPPDKFPPQPEGKDFNDVEVEFQIQNRPIVKRSVFVYDCTVHFNCTSCTKSNFGCEWHYLTHNCTTSSIGTGKGIKDSMACPIIDSPSRKTDIVVHSGESKQIAVRVVNLQPEQKDLQCEFEYLSTVYMAKAVLSASDVVTCDPIQFSFNEVVPYVTAEFRVNWGSLSYWHPLDNPTGIKVRIYKCPLMVTNCGQCLSLDQEYDCGWCNDTCTLQKNCAGQWMDRSSSPTCPNPKILRFSPSTGPINGKTNISVTGINLGINYGDIQNGVTVAGVRCHVHMEHFDPGAGFRCETDESNITQVGRISVTVDKQYKTESDGLFAFVDPEVMKIYPQQGSKSGGTVITIIGKNLNAGTQTTVTVGKSPCEVIRTNMTTLECMTSQHVDVQDMVQVQVSFGGYKRLLVPQFTFQDDPTITDIEPKRSILSGGTMLTVIGERLNIIQRPELFIEVNGQIHKRACYHIRSYSSYTSKWLVCRTPPLFLIGENITNTSPKEVQFGFNLDKVTTWRNISRRANIGPLMYFPDPVIQPFPGKAGDKKYKSKEKLVIEGSFSIMDQLMQDVKVIVGQTLCVAPEASAATITCTPPEKPDAIDSNGNALVQIKVGNLRQDVGYLNYRYSENKTKDKPIALGIILGVVLPIIAIIALLAICIIRRQRKNGPNKNRIPDMLKDYDGKDEEEEVGMNHVAVKADMNGHIPDSGPYISELLARIPEETSRQAISEFLIPRSKLDIGELIGKGIFGNSYQALYATATAAESQEKKCDVAVKSLLGCNTDSEAMDAFLQQCLVLKDLQHPNILPLMGLCLTASEEPHLVMPYLERGDVKTYVRDPAKNITVIELLEMAQQISEAMTYLESIHVVHGNLAARNCLLTDDKVVRVTGFGVMSLYTADYCKEDEDRIKIVTKWLAPESLENFQFSHKTDVWSYGIVLWELLTRGVTPYPDVESKDLKSYLEGGHRLKKPRQCPENLYVMMLQCWTDMPNDRPTFHEVNEDMKRFIPTHGQEEGDGDAMSDSQPLKSNIEPGGSAEYLEVVG